MTYYKQCVLQKGSTQQVAFVPEEFAIIGKFLRLPDDDGWQVREISYGRTTGEHLSLYVEREYLNHRKVTDI